MDPVIRRVLPFLLVTLMSLLAALPSFAAAIVPGVVCDGCHGTGGHSAGATIPSLAGQERDYFVIAMQDFRSGKRPSTVMGPLARGLTDTDIRGMAAYYARQTPMAQSDTIDATLVKAGMKVFYDKCKTCHLDGSLWKLIHHNRAYERECGGRCHLDYGPVAGKVVPLIGGQWREYLEMELAAFRDGSRSMSKRKARAFEHLDDAELAAVAAFFASRTELQR